MRRPRARRSCRRYRWPHLRALMDCRRPRLGLPRYEERSLVLIVCNDADWPMPTFGADWPAIRARILARLAEINPDHPWLKEETP